MPLKASNKVFFSDTRVINNMAKKEKYSTILDNILPFEQEGIQTTTITLQQSYQGITITEDRPRNSGGVLRNQGDGRIVTFRTNHFPIEGDINAPSHQDVNDINTGQLLSSMDLEIAKRFNDDIISFNARNTQLKFGVLKGLMLNENNETVGDLYSDFGYQRHDAVEIDLTSTVDDLARQIRNIQVLIQDNTYGRVMTQKSLMLTDIETFSAIANIVATTTQYTDQYFTTVGANEIITRFAVDIAAIYGSYNGSPFIEPGKGYVVPRGVPDFYMHKYAPPVLNSLDYVNKIASQPYYALRAPNKTNSGVTLFTESNPLFLIGDPRMLVQVDFTLP